MASNYDSIQIVDFDSAVRDPEELFGGNIRKGNQGHYVYLYHPGSNDFENDKDFSRNFWMPARSSSTDSTASFELAPEFEPFPHQDSSIIFANLGCEANDQNYAPSDWSSPTLTRPDMDFVLDNDFFPRQTQPQAMVALSMTDMQTMSYPLTREENFTDNHNSFTCEFTGCKRQGVPFQKKAALDRHQLMHRPPQFMCPKALCPWRRRGFHRKDKLMSHLERGHHETKEAARMIAWEVEQSLFHA